MNAKVSVSNNTYISIWGFIVKPIVPDLDVYAQWEAYRESLGQEEQLPDGSKENFIDLMNQLCLIAPVLEGTPEDESRPATMDAYFDWFFMKTDLTGVITPRPDDMVMLRSSIGDEQFDAMSVHDRELFATGHLCPTITRAGITRPGYFRWLSLPTTGGLEDKKMDLFRGWFKLNQEQAIARQGFAIQNVFSNEAIDTWRSYSYTYGVGEKLGYEILVVNLGKESGSILAKLAELAIETGGFIEDLPFNIPGYNLSSSGTPLTAIAREHALGDIATTRLQGAVKAGMKRCMQVFVCDKNGLLPGDEGYDTTFVQTLTPDTQA